MKKGLLTILFTVWVCITSIAQTVPPPLDGRPETLRIPGRHIAKPISHPLVNYDFDFSRLARGTSSWKLAGTNFTFSIDPVDQQGSVHALLLSGTVSNLLNTVATVFDCSISQCISLPKAALKGSFSLDTKAQNIEKLWVKIFCVDNSEHILRKDSINLSNSENWKSGQINVILKGASSIYIEIGGKSSSENFVANKANTRFSMRKLSLMVDGKDIHSFPQSIPTHSAQQLLDIKKNIALTNDDEQHFATIKDLKMHRFIALGETVSGSVTSQECAYNLMKQMILNSNCRLVLLDYPNTSTLQWNQYVQGSLETKPQEFLSPLVYGTKSPALFEAFLEWIKQYNAKNEHKVTIAGFDVQGVIYYNYLADYLLGIKKSSPFIDSLLYKVCKHQFKEALELTTMRDSLALYLKTPEVDLFVNALKNATRSYLNEGKTEIDRSFLRFNNIKEIITSQLQKDERAVLLADFATVNKLSVTSTAVTAHSVGYWLNHEYGNDFYSIAILFGNGLFTHANTVEITSANLLEQPMEGSLEDLCMKSGQSFFYKQLSPGLFNRSGYIRWIDRSTIMSQFEMCNYFSRMDALLFMSSSKGFAIPSDWPKNDKGFFDFNAALMKKDFELHFNKKFFRPTHRYRVYMK